MESICFQVNLKYLTDHKLIITNLLILYASSFPIKNYIYAFIKNNNIPRYSCFCYNYIIKRVKTIRIKISNNMYDDYDVFIKDEMFELN